MRSGSYSRVGETGRPEAELRPEFYMDSVRDDAASASAGREIYRSVERVKVIIPGMTATVVVHNVNQGHIERWPDAYDAFKRGAAMPLNGTPLEAWPMVNPAMLKQLHYHEIRTVEELAHISDNAVGRLGPGGMNLRQHARCFLDDSEHEAMRTELQAKCDGLESRLAAQQHQIDEMNKHIIMLGETNRRYAEAETMRRHYAEGPAGYPLPQQPYYPPPDALAGSYGNGNGTANYLPNGTYAPQPPAAPVDAFSEIPFSARRAPSARWSEEPPPAPTPSVSEIAEKTAAAAAYPPPANPTPPAYPPPQGHYAAPQHAAPQAPPSGWAPPPDRPAPPWGYGNRFDGAPPNAPGAPAPPPGDLRSDIRAEMARHGVVGGPAPDGWAPPA